MTHAIVVTATDTDVGKTVFAAGLTRAIDGCYWKPVQAGLEGGTDSETVRRLSGLPADRILPEAYRLDARPASPHHAAAIDNVVIDPALLDPPCSRCDRRLVIEGAGGLLVPLAGGLLFADIFARWRYETIIVARTTLGTINHSLLTIEAAAVARDILDPRHRLPRRRQCGERARWRPSPQIGRVKRPRPAALHLDPLEFATSLALAFDAAFDPARPRPMSGSPIWHPLLSPSTGSTRTIPLIVRAEGAYLFTADGRRYIDAISSWWVTTHGHRHPRIMAAIAAQVERLDQIIFAGWTHEPAETLAEELVRITPAPLEHVFFSDSGSTSVEVALKMALGTWLNRDEPAPPDRGDGTQLSWRHDRGDVGRRARRLQPRLPAAAVRRRHPPLPRRRRRRDDRRARAALRRRRPPPL